MKASTKSKTRKKTVLISPGSWLFGVCLILSVLIAVGCGTRATDDQSNPEDKNNVPSARAKTEAAETLDAAKQPVFTVDPCALITKSDAEAIAGGPMNEPLQDISEDPAGKGCRYFSTPESAMSRAVEINVWESDNLKRSMYGWPADEYFSRFKAGHENAGGDFEQLQGLGDDAYFWGSNVFILKSKYVLMVSARGFGSGGEDTERKNKEASIKAAQIAVGRLK